MLRRKSQHDVSDCYVARVNDLHCYYLPGYERIFCYGQGDVVHGIPNGGKSKHALRICLYLLVLQTAAFGDAPESHHPIWKWRLIRVHHPTGSVYGIHRVVRPHLSERRDSQHGGDYGKNPFATVGHYSLC
jgi:hypothetical protein